MKRRSKFLLGTVLLVPPGLIVCCGGIGIIQIKEFNGPQSIKTPRVRGNLQLTPKASGIGLPFLIGVRSLGPPYDLRMELVSGDRGDQRIQIQSVVIAYSDGKTLDLPLNESKDFDLLTVNNLNGAPGAIHDFWTLELPLKKLISRHTDCHVIVTFVLHNEAIGAEVVEFSANFRALPVRRDVMPLFLMYGE